MFTDWLHEAKVQVALTNGGDALAAAADVRPTARSLALMAAVDRSCPPERHCQHVQRGLAEPQGWLALLAPGMGLVAGLRHGTIACVECMAGFADLPPLVGDEELLCDVCGGFSDRPLSREVVPVYGGKVLIDRVCDEDAAFLASTLKPAASMN